MAVTYDRVDLSQINFNLLRHDYTDGMYPGFPIIADWGNDPKAHVAAQVKSSLFKTMIANGLNQMNLYDTNSNVIGEIIIQNYKVEYVTYERVGGFGDEQTSTTGYPEYRNQGHGGDWGVKYIRITRGEDPDFAYDIVTTITINGVTERRHFGQWGAIEVADYYGTLDEAWAYNIVCGSDGGPTLTLMSKTTGGTTHYYLEWSMLKGIAYTTPVIDYGFEYTPRDADLLADNLSFTEHVIEEDGYVNELNNRFSPRVYSDMTGIYLVDMDMMQTKVVPALVDYGFDDFIADTRITGGQGQNKECVQAIRWYYGIKDWIQKSEYDYDIVVGKNFLRYNGLPDSYIVTKYAKSEFCLWHTSKLTVPAHFNNYLDFVSSYKLYLPYYGFLDIEPNDIVGGTIQVFYGINLVTGHTNITVACKNSRTGNKDFKYYTVSCTVGEEIPFGTNLYKNMSLTLAMNVVDAAKFAINTGAKLYGAGASANIGQLSADTSATLSTNNAMINGAALAGAGESTLKMYANNSMEKATSNAGQIAALSKKNAYIQHANDVVQSIPNVPNVQRSSSFNSESGTMDELHPYLLITRPVNVEPADYEDYGGLPSSESILLSNCNGFTQIRAAHPDTMTNAPKYIDEILAQLQAGVYL